MSPICPQGMFPQVVWEAGFEPALDPSEGPLLPLHYSQMKMAGWRGGSRTHTVLLQRQLSYQLHHPPVVLRWMARLDSNKRLEGQSLTFFQLNYRPAHEVVWVARVERASTCLPDRDSTFKLHPESAQQVRNRTGRTPGPVGLSGVGHLIPIVIGTATGRGLSGLRSPLSYC